MTRAKLGATCAAVLLSVTFISAQTTRGRAPDRPLPNSETAKSAQTATISGCVVRDAANGGKATIAANGLSYKLTGRRDTELGDLLRDTSIRSPEEATLEGDLSNEVTRALAPLSDREKEVLRLRYGLGTDREYTLEEIGRRLSVTRERVRQIESRALQKVRAAKGAHALARRPA